MTRRKSQARFFSARFNPATSEEDALALDLIDQWIEQGYNFKAIVTDAILARAGHEPEMFNKPVQDHLIDRMEDVLAAFAEDLISRIGTMPRRTVRQSDDDEDSEEDATRFARNFAKGFMQRQKSGGES